MTHFWLRKVHLQEVADQLWPRLQFYLTATKVLLGLKMVNKVCHMRLYSCLFFTGFQDQDAFKKMFNPSLEFAYPEYQQHLVS